jgi:hypothetical protein
MRLKFDRLNKKLGKNHIFFFKKVIIFIFECLQVVNNYYIQTKVNVMYRSEAMVDYINRGLDNS